MRCVWVLGLTLACTPVTTAGPDRSVSANRLPGTVEVDTTGELPPTGFGSLRQDEFSVEIRSVNLRMKVTPLDERVIRLAAPDTYNRLRALVRSRYGEARQMTEAPDAELFLVSFFSRDPNVAYRPEDLRITHRGRSRQASGIVPLTTGWGRQLLQPQETQSAIYVFEPVFDYNLPMNIRYGMRESDDWHRVVLPRLEEERTRVESRSGGGL